MGAEEKQVGGLWAWVLDFQDSGQRANLRPNREDVVVGNWERRPARRAIRMDDAARAGGGRG